MSTIGTAIGACAHILTYWDEDEIKCRTCAVSLTYPPHAPGREDKQERARETRLAGADRRRKPPPAVAVAEAPITLLEGWIGCVGCEDDQPLPAPNDSGAIQCRACHALLLLVCTCCERNLSVASFYVKTAKSSARDGRDRFCRGCVAARQLRHRTAHPEEHRARARAYSQRIQQERVAGTRPPRPGHSHGPAEAGQTACPQAPQGQGQRAACTHATGRPAAHPYQAGLQDFRDLPAGPILHHRGQGLA